MDRIQESAPFIDTKMDRAREYSQIEEHDGDDDSQHRPPRALRSSRRLLPLASSFLLGVLTVALALAVWRFLSPSKTPNRKFPAMPEGVDEESGLPLSWSYGDCGGSPAAAQALGCRYSIILHAWLPEDCLTDADDEDERLMYAEREYPYVVAGRNLTMGELRAGQYHHFTTNFDWHATHCAYVWKRMHRAMVDADQKLDSYTANVHHTNHCVDVIGGDPRGLESGGTKIYVKYPTCA